MMKFIFSIFILSPFLLIAQNSTKIGYSNGYYTYQGEKYLKFENLDFLFNWNSTLNEEFKIYRSVERNTTQWRNVCYFSLGSTIASLIWLGSIADNKCDGFSGKACKAPIFLTTTSLVIVTISLPITLLSNGEEKRLRNHLINSFNSQNVIGGLNKPEKLKLSLQLKSNGVGVCLNF